jgi:ribonuclease BN (tRNA processing enzyme)
MRLRILGCSGGIGGRHLRTTSMLLDHDILVDAGTGVGELSLTELSLVDHVFLTHSHLDHVTSIPFIVDTVGAMRTRPLTVHGVKETLQILKDHVFNWLVWPDFSQIPSPDQPYLRYEEIQVGETVKFGTRWLTALPANHTVPAVGYQMQSGKGSLVFTGDTTNNDALWPIVNKIPDLKFLIIETAFCNRERDLAVASKHLCPSMLAEELAKLQRSPDIFITHLKPGEIELTMEEIEQCAGHFKPMMLQNNQVFEF